MRNALKVMRFLALGALAVLLLTIGLFYILIAVRPSGPYIPLAETAYFFDQAGAVKELSISPEMLRNHEVALITNTPFPVEKQFGGKIRVEVFRFGMKIDEHLLEEGQRSIVSPVGLATSDHISYGWIKVWDLLPGQATVRLTVLQPQTVDAPTIRTLRVVVQPSSRR